MAKEMILKIKDICISRSYGFHNGGYIVVGYFYKNHKPVKGAEDIIFSERGTIVERYAKACGINREDQLHTLIGKEVGIERETEIEDDTLYDVEYLTRPFSISKRLGLDKLEKIVGEVRDQRELEEELEEIA